MPFNGAGAYSLPAGSIVADGTTIDAADHNTPLQDIESSLSTVTLRNGATPFTANQSLGGNKITSLGAGTVATDAVNKSQLDLKANLSGGNTLLGTQTVAQSAGSGYGIIQSGVSATAAQNWHFGSEGDGNFSLYSGNIGSGTLRFRVDINGRAGVGTNTPIARLHVKDIGTLAHFEGSGQEFHGLAMQASDASGSVKRQTFIDTRNESNISVASMASYIELDGSSGTYFFVQGPGARTDRRVERFRITVNGFGYGFAGSTVTQITNKSTAVTINTPCGQIITTNSSLGANGDVFFTVNNSLVAATDTVILNISGGTADTYQATVVGIAAGSFRVRLQNYSAISRSEAVTINFALIKAVNA